MGLCDQNSLRLEAGRKLIGVEAPVFTDLGEMLKATKPETVIVCSRDSVHDDHIVTAVRDTPLIPGPLLLLFAFGGLVLAWWREGK